MGQGSDVGRERAVVFEDDIRPGVEKAAVAPSFRSRHGIGGVGVDIAGVPIGVGRYPEVAAAAVGVDARHHAVVAVLETGVDGIDMVGGGERTVEKIAAFLGAEIAGVRCGNLREQAQRAGDRVDQARCDRDAVVAGPCQFSIKDRG